MNDEPQLTAEQLRQATSPALPPDAALDAETAALRKSFLQLGRAVEAANDDFDEAELVARLTRTCLAKETQPAALPATKGRGDWVPLVLGAALAASALVAIVRTAAVWSGGEIAVAPQAPPGASESAANDLAAGVAPAWSDPLDDEIASAQATVEGLADRPRGLDGSLENFGSRLQSMSAELESGSL